MGILCFQLKSPSRHGPMIDLATDPANIKLLNEVSHLLSLLPINSSKDSFIEVARSWQREQLYSQQ